MNEYGHADMGSIAAGVDTLISRSNIPSSKSGTLKKGRQESNAILKFSPDTGNFSAK